MKKEIKKVPTIRFKEFTDDWEQRKLSEITSKIGSGKTPLGGAKTYKEEGIPLIRSQNINNDRVNLSDVVYIDVDTDELMSNSKVHKNDILLNITGASIGRSAVYTFTGKANVNQHVCIIRTIKGYDAKFIQMNLASGQGQNKIDESQAGGARQGLNFEQIGKLSFAFPPIEEQKAIGVFLASIDDLITLHQRKLKQLQTLKKYFLQNMFPAKEEKVPAIRFKGFTGDWKTCKFGDVFKDVKSGLSRMLSNFDIGLPVIRANNICDGKLDLKSDIRYWYKIDPQGVNTYNYLVNKDDILINFINSEAKMGTAAYVEDIPCRETIYTTNILRCRTFSDINSKFIFFLTFTQSYKNYIKSITKPAINQASFTTVDFKKYKILIPDIKEQIMISNLLTHVDNRITLQQRKLDQLQSLKKFMLQNLFI